MERRVIVAIVITDAVTGDVLDTRTNEITTHTTDPGYPKFCPYCPEVIDSARAQRTHNTVRHPG